MCTILHAADKDYEEAQPFCCIFFAAIVDTDTACDKMNMKLICTSIGWIKCMRGEGAD